MVASDLNKGPKMGAIVGCASVVWFSIKCLFLVPINIIKDGLIFRHKHGKSLSFDFMHRITIRTLVGNSNDYLIDWFINPYMKRAGDAIRIPNCPRRNTTEHASIRLTDGDLALVTKSFGAHFEKGVDVEMRWFVKSNTFDAKKDPVIYYIHGGGFRLKEIDSVIVFLGHIHEAYPEAAIVLVDYTLTSAAKNAVFPQQLLECVAGYDWLTAESGCQNVSLIGDSSGGNLALALLELLQLSARPAPKRAAVISPWVNPSLHDEGFAKHEIIDYLPADKLFEWGDYYTPGPEYIKNPFLNIEHNFETPVWKNLLEQTELLVTYGAEEMFHDQVKRFVEKLKLANPAKFSAENNVVVDDVGAHTSPLFFTKLDLKYWLSYDINRKFIRFLTSS
ncbi:hypothetical protein ZYGR_0N03180 [Zygosaccharomyces rouxii]|uniref:Alpha/beta hydrolase fold-3 domain-containing protein n=1 Tax=Zygosaccharomyces rouxii TaxID=4956 RepID=A0A1Q2ZZZ3_ZYGRO|nr:hypothetical protein ZYGR_0N03180 [Zygosaccharomyces rouxii]